MDWFLYDRDLRLERVNNYFCKKRSIVASIFVLNTLYTFLIMTRVLVQKRLYEPRTIIATKYKISSKLYLFHKKLKFFSSTIYKKHDNITAT